MKRAECKIDFEEAVASRFFQSVDLLIGTENGRQPLDEMVMG
ncbi:MAG TPA: hypothetical protein VID27_10765 [Blastocatellia bacterium]